MDGCDTERAHMPISLRIPPKQEEAIAKAAKKAGKTKTAFILDAVNEKLGLAGNWEQLVRKMAGWMSPKEASEIARKYATIFLSLTTRGMRIPMNDVWIAACCMGVGGTLVTRDRHFDGVEQIEKIVLTEGQA